MTGCTCACDVKRSSGRRFEYEYVPPEPAEPPGAPFSDAEITTVDIGEGADVAVSIDDEVVMVYPGEETDTEWYASLASPTAEDEAVRLPVAEQPDF